MCCHFMTRAYSVTIKTSAQNWYVIPFLKKYFFVGILLAKASHMAKPQVNYIEKYIPSLGGRQVMWQRALIYNLLSKEGVNKYEFFTQ